MYILLQLYCTFCLSALENEAWSVYKSKSDNLQIWLLPLQTKLLRVNNSVSLQHSHDQLLTLFLIHTPDITELVSIRLHEVSEK